MAGKRTAGARSRPGGSTGVSYAVLAARQPRQVRLLLPPDDVDALQAAIDAADQEVEAQKLRMGFYADGSGSEQLAELQATADKARKVLEDASTVVVLRALPRAQFEALRLEHPPTEKQIAEAEKSYGGRAPYNADTFEPALIAACLVADPPLTVEQVEHLRDTWSAADWTAVSNGVDEVNGRTRIRQLGN